METKTLFKKGQTVYDSALFGDLEGKVIDDNYSHLYPIRVEFGVNEYLYTIDGRIEENTNPTLSDQPYKVEYVPPQPQIEIPEVGQWCWFWDDDNRHFIYAQYENYDESSDFKFRAKYGYGYKHCSTTNPTEQ